jgi:hypothetical protein
MLVYWRRYSDYGYPTYAKEAGFCPIVEWWHVCMLLSGRLLTKKNRCLSGYSTPGFTSSVFSGFLLSKGFWG